MKKEKKTLTHPTCYAGEVCAVILDIMERTITVYEVDVESSLPHVPSVTTAKIKLIAGHC
jgi:hypothetical protein